MQKRRSSQPVTLLWIHRSTCEVMCAGSKSKRRIMSIQTRIRALATKRWFRICVVLVLGQFLVLEVRQLYHWTGEKVGYVHDTCELSQERLDDLRTGEYCVWQRLRAGQTQDCVREPRLWGRRVFVHAVTCFGLNDTHISSQPGLKPCFAL